MKTSLKWMRLVRSRLAAGAFQFVHSAWSGEPKVRIDRNVDPLGREPVGVTEFNGLTKSAKNISDLIVIYRASSSYPELSAATKRSYSLYLKRIERKFGALPIGVLDERGARRVLRQWRDDELAAQPRTADATMGVFRVLLNLLLIRDT